MVKAEWERIAYKYIDFFTSSSLFGYKNADLKY